MATAILDASAAIARDWLWLAIAWHVPLGAFLLGIAAGWRPSGRSVRALLALPIASVGVVAWTTGNVFNGPVFVVASAALVTLAVRSPADPIRLAAPPWLVAGAVLTAFGWAYPHFLPPGSASAYLYAAPFGLLPCPTLAAVVGVSLLVDDLKSGWWSGIVAAITAVYGLIGTFALGVQIDLALLAGVALLAVAGIAGHRVRRPVEGTR